VTVSFEVLDADAVPAAIATRFGASGYVVEAVPLALLIAAHQRTGGLAAVLERAVYGV
jgi:hypothetical protein